MAPDVLHEVEIGVWKSLFIHLLRLLEAVDKSTINILNKRSVPVFLSLTSSDPKPCLLSRFREVPGFGKDTIRCFGNNVSEMKQLAARDWEDLLQVRSNLVFDSTSLTLPRYSVSSQSLKACCLAMTGTAPWISFSPSPIGIHWSN